jgi:hypothetical protein
MEVSKNIFDSSPMAFGRGCTISRGKFTAKAVSGLVLFARYISAPIALRYGYSGPKVSSPSSHGRKGSLSLSRVRTIIGALDGYALSILNLLNTFCA